MTYPILEHDSTPVAFIEPSKVIAPMDVAEHCVLCFFDGVVEGIAELKDAKLIGNKSMGRSPLYEIEHRGQRLAFFNPGIGAPLAAARLEEAIGFGCRKFIACGACGVLDREIANVGLVVVTSAVRDEGLSYHYLPPAREVLANEAGVKSLEAVLRERGVEYRVGKTWTTDAPYRETPNKIASRKAEGCLTVEMESAAMMAVAQFRDAVFGQVLIGADDLSGSKWDRRPGQTNSDARQSIFWICADACLGL